MYRISKDFDFSASHVLAGLPDTHPCSRLHGHNYKVRVTLTSPTVDEVGFILDYRALAPFKDWLDATLDHHHLNDRLDFNPTAENLARWLAQQITHLIHTPPDVGVEVSVSETPKTWATWAE